VVKRKGESINQLATKARNVVQLLAWREVSTHNGQGCFIRFMATVV
jgi:hypothetical protein